MFLPFFYQVYKLWSGGKQGQEAAVLWRMIWGFVEEGKKEELWIVEEGKGVVFPLVGGGKVGSGHMWISFPIQDRLEQPGANSCLLLVMASSGYQLQFKIFVQVYLPLAPDEPEDQNSL